MKTLTDIIIVEQDKVPEKSEGGIWLPDEYRNCTERGVYTGTVKVAGPECKLLKEGTRIMFHRSACVEMEHEGKPFRALHEHEVIAVIEE